MRYDGDALTLRFASRDELDRFHRDLSDLLRRAIREGAAATQTAEEGAAHARDEMRRYATVARALNALRGSLRDEET